MWIEYWMRFVCLTNVTHVYLYIFCVCMCIGIFSSLGSLDLKYSKLFWKYFKWGSNNKEREHIINYIMYLQFRMELMFLNCQNGRQNLHLPTIVKILCLPLKFCVRNYENLILTDLFASRHGKGYIYV